MIRKCRILTFLKSRSKVEHIYHRVWVTSHIVNICTDFSTRITKKLDHVVASEPYTHITNQLLSEVILLCDHEKSFILYHLILTSVFTIWSNSVILCDHREREKGHNYYDLTFLTSPYSPGDICLWELILLAFALIDSQITNL